jgi:putative SOS response-associated peptidase YedK
VTAGIPLLPCDQDLARCTIRRRARWSIPTAIITDANEVTRVHDRVPVILGTDAAGRWIEPGPLPAELLVPYPADEMQACRVGDAAKSSRIEPHPGMTEPVAT